MRADLLLRLTVGLVAMWGAVVSAAPILFETGDAKRAYEAAAALVRDCTPRDAGTIRGRLAAGWILDRVSRSGVDAHLDTFKAATPDGVRTFSNVMVEFPAARTNAPWVVVMSHFDTPPGMAKGFEGANDGASTTGLLIALAHVLRQAQPFPDNLALVWTDAEECRYSYDRNDGFQGSKRLAALYREKKREVKMALCLDMLGDRNLQITVPMNTTPVLKKIIRFAAERAQAADRISVSDDLVVQDDHVAFLEAGWPAMTLIDFEYGSAPGRNDWWHTPQDTLDKISEDSLLVSGRLTVELLNLVFRR
jgi:Zn-dependent M28 family amino/carboxypeptidase